MGGGGTGREDEHRRLLAAAREAADGQGSVIFLAGPTGSGKSSLQKQLSAELADTRIDIVRVACHGTGTAPLGRFVEALRALTNERRGGERAKRILELLGHVAPLLLELIPGIGPSALREQGARTHPGYPVSTGPEGP